jgi:PAS domain S-box-containing protein
MLKSTTHLGLPRRVSAYFLIFGLATIAWFAVGIVMVSQSLVESYSETARVTNLVKTAAAAAHQYQQGGIASLRSFVDHVATAMAIDSCAVIAPQGRFLAHSRREFVGKQSTSPTGAVEHWGESERIRFVNDDSRVVREYRTVIRCDGKTVGLLTITYHESGVWDLVRSAVEYAPIAILGPFLLMSVGVLVLRRTVRPLSRVETELEKVSAAASVEDVELSPIHVAGTSASGWNRLAEHINAIHQRDGLNSRLAVALDGFRQRKAEQILNSLPDGVALTDDQGRITLANQSLPSLVGASGESQTLHGKRMEEILGFRDEKNSPHPLLDPNAAARTVVVEIAREGTADNGVLRIARYPLREANGDASGSHVWSVRDITQQKLADQMRTQFVDSATHELRTPLANIKAYAETLSLSDMLDVERQKEFCNTINSEATRLARFIDDLLSLSSIEAGSLSLFRQETDMERLLVEVLEKVRPQMNQRNIALRHAFPEKVPKLTIDKDKIIATLVNLLGNAAKYTPEGGNVLFRVSLKEDSLQIDIEDTGIGIAADEISKVFDKFYRSSDSRVQEQAGTGLGLSLAQQVVRLHGGKISVQSELNKGTRFTVILPYDSTR